MNKREQLIVARRARGWSQCHVASRLGISECTYTNWELNRTYPTPEYLKALCTLFEATPLELDVVPPPQWIERGYRVLLPAVPCYRGPNERLQTVRREHNWDVDEAALRLGMRSRNYQRIEEGVTIPSLSQLWLLCALFKRSPDDLGYPIYTPPNKA